MRTWWIDSGNTHASLPFWKEGGIPSPFFFHFFFEKLPNRQANMNWRRMEMIENDGLVGWWSVEREESREQEGTRRGEVALIKYIFIIEWIFFVGILFRINEMVINRGLARFVAVANNKRSCYYLSNMMTGCFLSPHPSRGFMCSFHGLINISKWMAWLCWTNICDHFDV